MEGLIGLLIWIAGNYFYYEYRKEGERSGFKRFVSFWMGFPLTVVTMLVVPLGKSPLQVPPPSEGDSLLEEIRRDRALREGQGAAELPEGSGSAGSGEAPREGPSEPNDRSDA